MALYSPADALPNALENVGTALSLLLPLVVACRFRAAARLTTGRFAKQWIQIQKYLNKHKHSLYQEFHKQIDLTITNTQYEGKTSSEFCDL